MDQRTISNFFRRRVPFIPLVGVLVVLAVLCLVLLVSAQPPVGVDKTASPEVVLSGETVQYTVVFDNETDNPANIDVISDTLPAGFVYLSLGAGSDIPDEPDNPAANPLVWSDHAPYTVPAHGTLTLIYNVLVNAPASSTPYENHLEALLGTGEVIEDDAPVTVGGVELDGAKVASASQVPKGQTVDYTVTFENSGTIDASLTVISDTLPANFRFRQMVAGPLPAPTEQGDRLIWPGPHNVPAGGQLQFTYRVVVLGNIGQAYQNSVEAAHNGELLGPYHASVTVQEAVAYVPLVIKTTEAGPLYRLAYETKKAGETFEIYAINADGTDDVNLSNRAGGNLDPVWSPDGTKLAWVNYASGTGEIIVANADGSGQINVSNHAKEDRTPTWSPDGTRLAFSSYRQDHWEVYLVNPDGTNLTQCTGPDGQQHKCQSHDPIYSPDGTKLAYVCGQDQYAEIYIRNADCTGWVRYTDNEVPDEALAWSPDSNRIAYVRYTSRQRTDSEIYVLNVTTAVNTKITNNSYADYSPVWSPDGVKIAFSVYMNGSYEIATMNPDGTGIVNMTQTAGGDYVPRWSLDGLKIAFISKRDGNSELYVMEADGSNQLRLTNTSEAEEVHDWQPQ